MRKEKRIKTQTINWDIRGGKRVQDNTTKLKKEDKAERYNY